MNLNKKQGRFIKAHGGGAMTYYETWDEMDPRTNDLTTVTDAPPGVVLVPVENYDRLRELVEEAYREGWDSSHDLEHLHTNWLRSNTRAALQEAGDD